MVNAYSVGLKAKRHASELGDRYRACMTETTTGKRNDVDPMEKVISWRA